MEENEKPCKRLIAAIYPAAHAISNILRKQYPKVADEVVNIPSDYRLV